MPRFQRPFIALLAALAAASCCLGDGAATAPAPHCLTTLDARTIEGRLLGLDGKQARFQAAEGPREMPLADVEQISLQPCKDLMAQAGQCVLVAKAGDVLAAPGFALGDGKVRFAHPLLGQVEMEFSAVSAIYMPASGETPAAVAARLADIAADDGADSLVVQGPKEWLGVDGIVLAADDQLVTISRDDKSQQVKRSNVRAIRPAGKAAQPPAGRLTLADGSSLGFASLAIDDTAAMLQCPGLATRTIELRNVAAVAFRSPRVAELGELKPASVKEYGLFDVVFPHRVNREVGGGPLRLGGKTYERGLGFASFSEITYDLGGQYKTFVAVVGIDDSLRPAGNAAFAIIADGKELASMTLTGKDDPREVRLDVTGVKMFTIRVDFGPDKLPVGDHVDVAVARLVK